MYNDFEKRISSSFGNLWIRTFTCKCIFLFAFYCAPVFYSTLAHLPQYTFFAPSPPPPILRSLCFQLSWVLQSSQGKLKTLLMQNLWGKTKCIKGDVQVANYVIWFTRTVLMLSTSNRLPPLSRWPVYTIYFCSWFVNEFLLSVSCCQVLRWRQQSQGRRPTTCHVRSP